MVVTRYVHAKAGQETIPLATAASEKRLGPSEPGSGMESRESEGGSGNSACYLRIAIAFSSWAFAKRSLNMYVSNDERVTDTYLPRSYVHKLFPDHSFYPQNECCSEKFNNKPCRKNSRLVVLINMDI